MSTQRFQNTLPWLRACLERNCSSFLFIRLCYHFSSGVQQELTVDITGKYFSLFFIFVQLLPHCSSLCVLVIWLEGNHTCVYMILFSEYINRSSSLSFTLLSGMGLNRRSNSRKEKLLLGLSISVFITSFHSMKF